jgi:uncharacterized protein YbgA (DUF1722 family)
VGNPQSPRLIAGNTKQDHTERMMNWCSRRVRELEKLNLCGSIFKKGSPSCGMEQVKVHSDEGMPLNWGVGIFAGAFMERFPLLPAAEEGGLHDSGQRENFVEATFVLKRWRGSLFPSPTRGRFIEFHTTHKLLLMAHSPTNMRLMGKLVADVKDHAMDDFQRIYQQLLMEALRLKTTPPKHTCVLMHCMGFLKRVLTADEKTELIQIIDQYRQGSLPLIVPTTLLNHYVRKYDPPYLKDRYYLRPHPIELKLRNHA